MGQREILNLLKKHPNKYYSTNELSLKLRISKSAIRKSVMKLEHQKFILTTDYNKGKKRLIIWSGK